MSGAHRLPWGLVLLALGIRLALGCQHDLNTDEAMSYYVGLLSPSDVMRYLLASDRHPPLHYLLLTCIAPWASSEIALRLPSIIATLVTLAVSWHLALRLTRNPAVAALAVLLQAICYGAWSLDVQARGFSIATAAATTATWLWARLLLEEAAGHGAVVAYLACFGVGIGTFYPAGFMLVGHFLALVAVRPRSVRAWIALAGAGAMSLPLAWLARVQTSAGSVERFDPGWSLAQCLNACPTFLGVVTVAREGWSVQIGSTPWLATAGLFTAICVAWSLWTLRLLGRKERLFLVWGTAGFLLPLLLAGPVLQCVNLRDRYLLPVLPLACIGLAMGLARIPTRLGSPLAVGLIGATNAAALALVLLASHPKPIDMKPMADRVLQQGAPGDLLVAYLPNNSLSAFTTTTARRFASSATAATSASPSRSRRRGASRSTTTAGARPSRETGRSWPATPGSGSSRRSPRRPTSTTRPSSGASWSRTSSSRTRSPSTTPTPRIPRTDTSCSAFAPGRRPPTGHRPGSDESGGGDGSLGTDPPGRVPDLSKWQQNVNVVAGRRPQGSS